jgi:predicted Zn-dependent peptidase
VVTRFPIERWRLANGLTVVVQPDRRWPLVASTMCYEAGSRFDPPSRSGLAHLCEHLAFNGPSGDASGAFPERIERIGGSSRARTTNDCLCFSTIVPSAALAAMLDVEAARMARPFDADDADVLAIERRILRQELRGRSQTRLRAAAFEQLHRLLFAGPHPYHRPPAGDADGISAIAAADVRAFARRFSPCHAALVLVGDVSVAEAAGCVQRAFGTLPAGTDRGGDAPTASPIPPPAQSLRAPAAVSRTHAHVGWSLPGFGQAEWYLASLLVRGLAVGRSSPLAQELVERAGLAEEVHGHLLGMRDASTMVFSAVGHRGVASDRLEQSLFDAIDRWLAAGLSASRLARARRKALTDHYITVQSVERRADVLASLNDVLQAPDRLDGEPQRYLAPDEDDVAAFGGALQRRSARATLSLVPWAAAA